MITYKKGDAVKAFRDGEVTLLAHGCNSQGVMGSGIAKQIKAQFPECFKKYSEFCTKDSLGETIFYWETIIPDKIIANCITQNFYGLGGGRFVDYNALRSCLQDVQSVVEHHGMKVGMPKIGAGLGGGDWKVIEAIIEEVFGDTEVVVYEL